MNGRRSRVAAVVFALLAFQTTPALAAPPITAAEAIALIKASPELKIDTREPAPSGFPAATHPAVDIQGSDGSAGYLSAEYAKEGTLSDGSTALAIPLDSDGSGGIFSQLIFARQRRSNVRLRRQHRVGRSSRRFIRQRRDRRAHAAVRCIRAGMLPVDVPGRHLRYPRRQAA
jgi:hypothetical protein